MKFLVVFLCLSFVLLASGKAVKPVSVKETAQLSKSLIEWPFFLDDDEYYLRTIIAKPAQPINVSMHYFYATYDLRVKTKITGGDYDASASGTAYEEGSIYDDNGNLIGYQYFENFALGKTNLVFQPFTATDAASTYNNYMGFGKPVEGQFLDSILSTLDDKTLTYAFDQFPNSGVMTIGGTDVTRCYKDWRIVKEAFWGKPARDHKWGAKIDSLSSGKYLFSDPGYLMFTIYEQALRWPKSVYYPLLKALGSTDDRTVPCDTTVNIVFKLEDLTFELTPDEYLDRDMQQAQGVCLLSGSTVDSSDEYILPQSIFKNYCLSVNHYKEEIGLATRRT